MTKLSYLSWNEFGRDSYSLARKVKASKIDFDLVIGIARGGIPVALVIDDFLNIKTEVLTVKSYVGIKKRTKPKILSRLNNSIKGKRVLIADDLIDYGDTMEAILKYLKKKKPAEMKVAVLYKKPWSRIEPDFYLKVVDSWIVFPWNIYETKRLGK